MKRLCLFGAVFALTVFLVSCKTPDETIDVEFRTYGSDVSYTVESIDYDNTNTYIDVSLNWIEYIPISNTICVSYQVDDSEYLNAIYFTLIQDPTTFEVMSGVYETQSSSEEEHEVCLTVSNMTEPYALMIGKQDTDDPEYNSSLFEATVKIEIDDAHINERQSLPQIAFDQVFQNLTESPIVSSIVYDLSVLDPQNHISELRAVIQTGLGVVVDEVVLTEHTSTSGFELLGYTVEDLVPGVSYEGSLYLSGNDGVDEYEDILLVSDQMTADYVEPFRDMNEIRFHEMYGRIVDVQLNDTSLDVSYYYKNDGPLTVGGESLTGLKMYFYNEDGELVHSQAISPDQTQVSIPSSSVQSATTMTIEDIDHHYRFDALRMQSKPILRADYEGPNMFYLHVDANTPILSIDIAVYHPDFNVAFEVFEDLPYAESTLIELAHVLPFNVVEIQVTIEYTIYGETIIEEYWMDVFVNRF